MTHPRRFAVAVAAAAAVILSAPFVQQLFTEVSTAWGPRSRILGIGATAVPVGIALVAAVVRIRDRRPVRYFTLGASLLAGAGYIGVNALSFTESFHFVEYGLLAWLFYRALRPDDDGAVLVLPLLAGFVTGTLDEWFQWFIPIRAGEARDILLDTVASGCGLLFAVSVEPPRRLTVGLERRSFAVVGIALTAGLTLFALFVLAVHVGHEVRHPDIGSFRSRYTANELAAMARDRARRWVAEPPVTVRRLSREDQYLSEGLWHVQRRNEAWSAGDLSTAWRENRILETFYAPILDTATYADPSGHRWPADQRADAEQRPGIDRAPRVSDAYPYPILVWPAGS